MKNLAAWAPKGKYGGYRLHNRKVTAKVSQGNVGRKPVSARLCKGTMETRAVLYKGHVAVGSVSRRISVKRIILSNEVE